MKLSLTWIFDHIDQLSWRSLDVERLIEQLSITTAEIEYIHKTSFNPEPYSLASVINGEKDHLLLRSPEWNKEFALPQRQDGMVGSWYLVARDNKSYRYATMQDLNSEKEGAVPPLYCSQESAQGLWKETCEKEDYILVIDNKSITHRPDLWSHRGLAREIAALLGTTLVSEDRLVTPCIIKSYERAAPANGQCRIPLEIAAPDLCPRLAALCIPVIENKNSLLSIAHRLARINARPINAVVDATNYVMYDLGQPLHAFDSTTFTDGPLAATRAEGYRLQLLDNRTITLSANDCVIADKKQVYSLAGIMGGTHANVNLATTQLLVESAHFNPLAIRRTSTHHKTRTEASARFEKDPDANQNTTALMRFLSLLKAWHIPHTASHEIISLGRLEEDRVIKITHEFINKKLGITVLSEKIVEIITKLGFGVKEHFTSAGTEYHILVPSYRSRDVHIKEDLVEEVARYIGYNTLRPQIPTRPIRPVDNSRIIRIREIKQHFSFGLGMRELVSYPLYDEAFLRTIHWSPSGAPELSNPVSENWRRLVTSLVPHLFKALHVNSAQPQSLRFFEWSKIWHQKDKNIYEQQALAALWYEPQNQLNFYAIKASISSFFDMIGAPVTWNKPSATLDQWYHPYQTAQLQCGEYSIGHAGILLPSFLKSIASGSAFVCELDGTFLQNYKKPLVQAQPLSRYPCTEIDISMLVNVTISVSDIEHTIASSDGRIQDVYLIDHYENPEWQNQRSITIRYKACDPFKTLTKDEIDEIADTVKQAIQKLGATIR